MNDLTPSVNAFPNGSHMPLDIRPYWTWRNPLNLIPATIIAAIVLALLAGLT